MGKNRKRDKNKKKKKNSNKSKEQWLSRKAKRLLGVILVMGALFIWGVIQDFVPAYAFFKDAWTIVILLTVVFTLWYYWHDSINTSKPLSNRLLLYLIVPVFILGFNYFALVHGVSVLVTKVFGTEYEEVTVLRKWKKRKRFLFTRTYIYSLRGTLHGYPVRVRIDEDFYEKHPGWEVKVKLIGLQSPAGFLIESYSDP